ncbi:MAG: SufE family protein [Alphaproteobacteria bacterium]
MTYAEIKKTLDMVDDPATKLEMVMDFGARLENVPDGAKCSDILGCTSHVEICSLNGKLYGRADSGIVRGIVAILLAMVDGKGVDEIKKMDLWSEFSSLKLQLGTGRVGGVNSIIRFLQNL